MKEQNVANLFRSLVLSQRPQEVAKVLASYGDGPDVTLNTPFGPLGLEWLPVGGNTSNISTIGLATHPGRALIERITNATDAVLEKTLAAGLGGNPGNPHDLAGNIAAPSDRQIHVSILPGDNHRFPTVDVLDAGIGIKPEDFRSTILSLQAGNKIRKHYLIGTFGQGGSATLAFSDYVLIVSRSAEQPNRLGFTVIRIVRLGSEYKEDTYAYLALKFHASKSHSFYTVPEIEVGSKPLSLYKPSGVKTPTLSHGTLVRHYGYKLGSLSDAIYPRPGNLQHFGNANLPEPILPYRVLDLRTRDGKDVLVSGARNHLRALPDLRDWAQGSYLRYRKAIEHIVPRGHTEPSLDLEIFVVYNLRKAGRGKKDEIILRPRSNEMYCDPDHPIMGLVNGQVQGTLTPALFREAGLPLTARHAVCYIDATAADSRVRRELFSTTREGFKQGEVLAGIQEVLLATLREDPELAAIERELSERLVKDRHEETSEEVRRTLTNLLVTFGLKPQPAQNALAPTRERGLKAVPTTATPLEPLEGSGGGSGTSSDEDSPRRHFFKVPTRLEVPETIEVPKPGTKTLTITTNANNDWADDIEIALPDFLEVASMTPLKEGTASFKLRVKPDTAIGESGEITVSLGELSATSTASVVQAAERHVKRTLGEIPHFDIVPISPSDNVFTQIWPDAPDPSKLAYKPVRTPNGIMVFYNVEYAGLTQVLAKTKLKPRTYQDHLRTTYEVWIGYHAILQEYAEALGLDPLIAEPMLEQERCRVAQVQAMEAYQATEDQFKKGIVAA